MIAPGLAEDRDYLRGLGVAEVLDRNGGQIVSSVGAAGEGPGRSNAGAVPTRENLDRLAGLLADGTLRVPIQASYPLAQADQALKALTSQHTQGKVAVTLP